MDLEKAAGGDGRRPTLGGLGQSADGRMRPPEASGDVGQEAAEVGGAALDGVDGVAGRPQFGRLAGHADDQLPVEFRLQHDAEGAQDEVDEDADRVEEEDGAEDAVPPAHRRLQRRQAAAAVVGHDLAVQPPVVVAQAAQLSDQSLHLCGQDPAGQPHQDQTAGVVHRSDHVGRREDRHLPKRPLRHLLHFRRQQITLTRYLNTNTIYKY